VVVTKRLVVCCDGTWNRPDQLSGGVVSPTNVSKLALGVARKDGEGTRQLLYYHRGVGTDRFERIRGGVLGFGLSRNVRDCYRFLVENYRPGDELYFFGFSRGAFTARSTVGLVRNAGILRPEHVGRIKEAYRLYRGGGDDRHPNGIEARIFRRMYSHEDLDIHFVGVWDTVGSLGIPGLRGRLAKKLWGFHDTALSSHVRFAHQALAIDEQRGPFQPTLWHRQQPQAGGQTLEQVWFAGVHSDVGGGLSDPALAEIPLLWMAQRARACGLAFEPGHFRRPGGGVDPEQRWLGAQIAPDPLGAMHNSRKGPYRLLPRRPRKLIDPDGSACAAVASSVVRRREGGLGYAPAELEQYLATEGPIMDVDP
jgi:uncharacterized protein (DUF2235 family)